MKRENTVKDLPEAVSRAVKAAGLCFQFCPGQYSADLVYWLGLTRALVDRLSFDGDNR